MSDQPKEPPFKLLLIPDREKIRVGEANNPELSVFVKIIVRPWEDTELFRDYIIAAVNEHEAVSTAKRAYREEVFELESTLADYERRDDKLRAENERLTDQLKASETLRGEVNAREVATGSLNHKLREENERLRAALIGLLDHHDRTPGSCSCGPAFEHAAVDAARAALEPKP